MNGYGWGIFLNILYKPKSIQLSLATRIVGIYFPVIQFDYSAEKKKFSMNLLCSRNFTGICFNCLFYNFYCIL